MVLDGTAQLVHLRAVPARKQMHCAYPSPQHSQMIRGRPFLRGVWCHCHWSSFHHCLSIKIVYDSEEQGKYEYRICIKEFVPSNQP